MALIVVGASHRTAPIEVREKFAIGSGEISATLTELRDTTGACEAALLSTCNRTEFYVVEGERDAAPAIWERLSSRLGADATGYGYIRRERDAVAHLFRVAAGMDSMILGESQIQGQVRDAWESSRAHSGVVLNRLFQSAAFAASRVRSETAIGRGAASVSSASVQLAKKIFGHLAGRRAMVLGAGETAELALDCLASEGVRTSLVANRTYERAADLALRYAAIAIGYEEFWSRLHEVDLLICSTAAPHVVVTTAHVAPAMARRRDAPLCILDIALPRDVEPTVGELENVFLYDLDDLRSVVAASLEQRSDELPSGEQVIAAEVEKYWEWLAGLAAVPVLRQFRAEMEQLRQRELADAIRRLGPLTPEQRDAIDHLSKSLMNKFLHEPSVRLRAAAANGRGLAIVDAARYLFALGQSDTASTAHPLDDEGR